MEPKVTEVNDVSIDYSTSSVEVFPAARSLAGSEGLYFKFSKNRIKFTDAQHTELLLDFDLCLIDKTQNETIMQLFAIFVLTKNGAPLNDISYIEEAVAFGKSLIDQEIQESELRDAHDKPVVLPALANTPEFIHLFE